MFDLRALRYFVAAYEEGSITAAAKRCHIAQPSITASIRNLEDILGVRLFERARQGLTATADGQKLYPQAKGLIAESHAILHGFREAPQHELRLQIHDDVLIRKAGMLIHALHEQIPNIRLRLTRDKEPCDLRIVSEYCKRDNEWFQAMWEEEYVVLVPDSHPLRFRTAFDLSDFHGSPFIDRPYCALHQVFSQMLAQHGIVPDVRASATREETVLGLVELGLGIAVVPHSHSEDLHNVVVRPLKQGVQMKRKVGLACAIADRNTAQIIRSVKHAIAGTGARVPRN